MSKRRRPSHALERRAQIAQTVQRRLVALVVFLAGSLLLLGFKMGEAVWPYWLLQHRLRMIAILVLALVCVIALAPLMIEAASNTRTLTGPGKNPKLPPLD